MADKETKLSLIIRAVDEATGPLKKINEQLQKQNAPFKAFGEQLKKFGEESGLTRLGQAFKGVGVAVANVGKEAFVLGAKLAAIATGAGYAFYSVIRGAVSAGSELELAAKRVGLSVDAYAQLRFAAEQAGVPQEQFNSSMDQFNKRLGEVKAHSGPIYEFLGKVGPGLLKQVEGAKSTGEAFDLMVTAMEAIPDPARRAALTAELVGRGGKEMGEFMGQGTAAIDVQKKKFLEIAGPQDEFTRRSRILDKQMHQTETAFKGVRNSVATALMPAFNRLAVAVTDLIVKYGPKLTAWAEQANSAILTWVNQGGIDRLVAGFKEFAASATSVATALGGFSGIAKIVGLYMAGPLIGSVLNLGLSFLKLGLAGLEVYKNWAVITKAFSALVSTFGGAAVAAAPFLLAAVGIGAAAYQIYKNWEPLKQLFSELWDTFKQVTTAFTNFDIKGGFKTIGKYLGFESAYDSAFKPPAANPGLASGPGGGGQSRVTVDFNNVPRGVAVTPERGGTAALDLSVGKAMSQ